MYAGSGALSSAESGGTGSDGTGVVVAKVGDGAAGGARSLLTGHSPGAAGRLPSLGSQDSEDLARSTAVAAAAAAEATDYLHALPNLDADGLSPQRSMDDSCLGIKCFPRGPPL